MRLNAIMSSPFSVTHQFVILGMFFDKVSRYKKKAREKPSSISFLAGSVMIRLEYQHVRFIGSALISLVTEVRVQPDNVLTKPPTT